MSNVEKLLIQTFVKSDGERHCLLVNSLTGLPQFFPNLFVTTQIRNASLSLSAMESVLVSISVLLHFCAKNNIEVDIHQISGSVEIAPNIGLSDAIVDIVSSGSTLFKNGLKEVEVILKSEAVLAVSPQISDEAKQLVSKLQFRIQSVLRSRKSKYILMNVPNDKISEISKILPVLKSPTVMPLAEEGWSSVHSVIDEDKFWEVIDQLKEAGAEGILVCPIEKMVL